ncbi:chaperone modulator CbpM [Oceaniradius stylonematis]|jgi:chaperone modulatory protein CbpM|uniref:chaperone modulator CbpM n=1 Tax=Oceaniradius stylonematis TaxID=2184161 RepID=UPI0035CF4AF5
MRWSEADVVAQVEQITVRRLRLWVRRGWIAPARNESETRFDDLDLARIRLVRELKDDLNLNDDAVPVVLSLLDQVHGLRRELRNLARAVDAQPEATRHAVRDAYRQMLRD